MRMSEMPAPSISSVFELQLSTLYSPMPVGTPAMSCGMKIISAEDVQAKTRRPMGRIQDPMIQAAPNLVLAFNFLCSRAGLDSRIILASGGAAPCCRNTAVYFFLLTTKLMKMPIRQPPMTGARGRSCEPRSQCRSVRKAKP